MRTSTFVAAALAGLAAAQRPANTSICDYYTTALLKNNTAANQYTILTLLVNTVVIGNYTKPNISGVTFPDVAVPGILANGTYMGTPVNLLPYFDGGLASSNRGGSSGVAVNFLDGGGAAPLEMNMPANGTGSNQYLLLTHLYQFFGTLLGCSQQSNGSAFPSYQGDASQYSVHKYMDLDSAQVGYFIQQVGLAAESFGVATSDITAVATALEGYFDVRCAPPTTIIPVEGPQLQSICIAEDCPLAPNSTCSSYQPAVLPGVANSTLADGLGNVSSTATASAAGISPTPSGSATGSSTASGSATASSGAAVANAAGVLAAGGLAAFAFLL
jgi:hypothetical protein